MKDMTKGSPLRLILAFALPLLLGNILQQCYNIADAAIVGRFLGSGALAAVGATSSVQLMILGFCTGACAGFCVPLAQRFGAQDYKGMRSLLYNSILLVGILSAGLTVLCVLLTNIILHILSIPVDIWDNTYIYILIIFLGIPFTLLYNLSAGILRAVGDSRPPFLILAVSTVTNIGLDLFCIAVLRWGCAGAAVATVAAQAFSGILCTYFVFRKYEFLRFRRSEMRADRHRCVQLLRIGIPMGLQVSIIAIGSMVMQAANNSLGSVYVSAFTAAVRIKMFAMCPFDAIATAVATFCSQNYGAGNYERIRTGARIGNIVAIIYGLMIGLMLALFGRTACMLFLPADEPWILDPAGQYLRWMGYFYWVLGPLNVCRLTVQSLGYSGRAMFSGVMEMAARILIVTLFVRPYGFDAICVTDQAAWISGDLYIIPTCIAVLKKVKRSMKRSIDAGHRAEP